MATIDDVMQLQSQGMSDSEIIKRLRDQGASPKDINDSLAQAKIKSAVQQDPGSEVGEMEQSIMQPQEEQMQEAEQYAPQQYQQQYTQPAQDYQAYPDSTQYQQPADAETISEIAEQVVSDKFKEFEQKTGDLSMFRTSVQEKIQDLNERLKRIENSLDKIQQAIIGKIGEFGENMTYMHKDMENLHNTVSKLMNPLMDNYQELRRIAGKK